MLPKLIGSICAFIALAFSVINQVGPTTALIRGAVAFLIGWVAASVLAAMLGYGPEPSANSAHSEAASDES
ncbi:MAG: hypothetical protein WCO51_04450 [bacterium]